MKSIVLLSGGLDSAVAAYVAKSEGCELVTLSFDYGQRHYRELFFARKISESLGASSHIVHKLNLERLGSSLLAGGKLPEGEVTSIPSTWIPQRNSIFLAIAFAYAEVLDASEVYIGATRSVYPDCQPNFFEQIAVALNLASKQFLEEGKAIYINVPLQKITKTEVVKYGIDLGVDFKITYSCYRGEELACGKCPPCTARLKAFKELGLEDTIEYDSNT